MSDELESELRIVEETSILKVEDTELLVTGEKRVEILGIGVQGARGVDGGGLDALVSDPNPRLGGDLDLNGYAIEGQLENASFVMDGGLLG